MVGVTRVSAWVSVEAECLWEWGWEWAVAASVGCLAVRDSFEEFIFFSRRFPTQHIHHFFMKQGEVMTRYGRYGDVSPSLFTEVYKSRPYPVMLLTPLPRPSPP